MKKYERQTLSPLYSEAFKRKVVSEINHGIYTVLEAMRKYNIGGKMTIYNWLVKYNLNSKSGYGGNRMSKKKNTTTDEAYTRIRNLEKLVSDLSIENRILKATIEIADETYDTDLKKNIASKSLSEFEKKKRKS